MTFIIGMVIVFGCLLGGFAAMGGHIGVLWQPWEYVIILGSAMIEQFASELTAAVKGFLERGDQFALVTAPEARPYVRLIVDRLFPTLPVLSHIEIAKGVKLDVMASLS
ncbi:MAG: FHIPEP family type III secretion protein [Aestuariivirga sp.]|nr:FHIPEP family type III secretion protein [Aestuariivirga sp.]